MKTNINFPVRTHWVKASTVFLTCILFLSLPGCEEIKTPEELLIGTWFMESIHVIEHEYGMKTADSTYNFDPYEHTILFQKDRTGKEYGFEELDYYFSKDPFTWIIYDYDSDSCEYILEVYKYNIGVTSVYCCSVNEKYLTLHFFSEYSCDTDEGPSDGPNPPWSPVFICKGGGTHSSGDLCSLEGWYTFKRE